MVSSRLDSQMSRSRVPRSRLHPCWNYKPDGTDTRVRLTTLKNRPVWVKVTIDGYMKSQWSSTEHWEVHPGCLLRFLALVTQLMKPMCRQAIGLRYTIIDLHQLILKLASSSRQFRPQKHPAVAATYFTYTKTNSVHATARVTHLTNGAGTYRVLNVQL
jgi:hypothetical protein